MRLRKFLIAYFDWIRRMTPALDESDRLRVAAGMMGTLLGTFFSLVTATPLFLYGEPEAGWMFICLAVLLVIGAVVMFSMRWFGITVWAYYNFVSLVVLNFAATVLMGGVQGSGAMILWSLLAPLLSPILLTPRDTLFWSFVFMLSLGGVLVVPGWLGQTSNLPQDVQVWLTAYNIGGSSAFTLMVMQFFIAERNLYQERSDNLLLNILPREIADILRNENRIIADAFDGASILFADVVDFTPLSQRMSPVELVELLNEVFSHFDALVEKYQLEKIKTIGDCYMVASGIPRARADHAQAVTSMALEILHYVQSREFRGHKLAFRIGINSGPVVAGVIGQKKFAYDLWGDSVNTASRMESHGEKNVIQVTRSTYELIKDDFVCEAQKPIQIKGKGEMEVWHVTLEKNNP